MNANELAKIVTAWAVKESAACLSEAATMLRKQAEEIEYWKDKFNKAMEIQEIKPAKYSAEWWKEVEEFNKQIRAQEK